MTCLRAETEVGEHLSQYRRLINSMNGRVVLVLMLVGAMVVPAAAEDFVCTITAPRPARAFFPHEPIYLTITANGPRQQVSYTIRDYDGRTRIVDNIALGEDEPILLRVPFDMPLGIYYLTLTFPTSVQVNDAFCVIPRPDDEPGDYGLFGFHCHNESYSVMEALAQIGVRIIRNDMDWVSTEPAEGQYSLGKARRLADLYSKYGMQWIPILGYTPRWLGMRPANATGRAAIASHTWPPPETTHWAGYMKHIVDYLGARTVHWPSEEIIARQDAYASEDVPLVDKWEIWNEVDQNFYYGYWHRYLDLLRIAYGTIKDSDYHDQVLYGGACAHWTELGMTYHANCQYYFDQLTFHPPGDSNIAGRLEVYYTGSPQIGNGYGIYHPTTITEGYPQAPAGLTHAEYMYRFYATLKKWGLRTFCTFEGGGRLVGAPDPGSSGLVWTKSGQLIPNAKYVAFAVARWVLSDAVYVGPLDLGSQVWACLFLKNGRPMLVAWADQDTTVQIDVADDARVIDEMGRKFPVAGEGLTRSLMLTGCPTVIYGVHYLYFSKAIHNQAEVYLTTPQGFETNRDFGYIAPLQSDAAWAWDAWPGQFRRAIDWATTVADKRPRVGPRALAVPQMIVHGQMYRVARRCIAAGEVVGRTPNILYRLQTLSEWLGRVADARDECWEMYNPRSSAVDKLNQRIADLRAEICRDGTVYPLAQQALERAEQQLSRAIKRPQGGAYRAAVGGTNTAALLSQSETPVVLDVFAIANFPTATQLVKAVALPPGQEHNLQVRIYNFTDKPVAGTITWQVPETWNSNPIAKTFSAPAQGYSELIDCMVQIPGEPRPWVRKESWSPLGNIPFLLPEPLAQRSDLYLKGQLDDGRKLLTMCYAVNVGEWISS